jgi:glycosyltransferase involved in cell wall biosynthesis
MVLPKSKSVDNRRSAAIIWTELNGYFASCVESLAAQGDIRLRVFSGSPGTTKSNNPFAENVSNRVPLTLLDANDRTTSTTIIDELRGFDPDVVFLSGWSQPWCAPVANAKALRNAKFVLLFDNPYRDNIRQRLAPLVLRRFLKRFDAALVPGERAWQFARRLGFREEQIHKGLYGVDTRPLFRAATLRSANPWPRNFLFVGQLIERKGVDILAQAYSRYMRMSSSPWKLLVAGEGPLRNSLEKIAGSQLFGFVQPSAMEGLFAQSGCLLLPSRVDAWPLALVEACLSGLPVICSLSCGSAVENVRDWYNGRTVPAGDPVALSNAMLWMESNSGRLSQFGDRSRQLASPYTCDEWAQRISSIIGSLTD